MGNTGVNGTDTLPPDELVVASIAHGDARAQSHTLAHGDDNPSGV